MQYGKTENKAEPPTVATTKRRVLTPEQIASHKRAHDLKVVKFQAGGEF